ncbi:hypothetical protein [Serratia fonticola]|uniref:hypothetical protein n=1 Tax=Serratia fonticola TaxID=47917 RepID=UPI002DBA0BA5|nr:hypothetical protein [Serratia fonticola]MEB7886257.1 hypothetical protein [Serratia fonticola]
MKNFLSEKIIFKKNLITLLPLISLMLIGCDSAEKRQFMTGCKIATRNGSVCACAWEKMSAIYPPKLLKAIGEQKVAAPFGFQNDMTNSLQQCIREE